MVRPLFQIAIALGAGSLLGDGLRPREVAVLLGLAAMLLGAAPWSERGSRRALIAAALALGAANRGVEGLAYERAPLHRFMLEDAHEGAPIAIRGTLAADPREVGEAWRLIVDVTQIAPLGASQPTSGRVRVDVSGTAERPALREGDGVELHAVLRRPRGSATPGVSDAERRARREGVHGWGRAKSPLLVRRAGSAAGPVRRAVVAVRAWARSTLVAHTWPGPERALVLALVLGDRTSLDPGTSEGFRRSGTYHVLAISGAQVAVLVGVLLVIARRAGASRLLTLVAVGALTLAYAAVVGSETPVVRAAIMAVVLLVGRWLDVEADLVNLLGAAAVLLIAVRPSQIEEPSFQLSFLATLGLLAGAAPLARLLPRLPWRLELGLAASVAAQAALAPLMIVHFHRLAPAGLLLNLVAVPLSSVVLLLGLACLLGSPIPVVASALGTLASLAARLLLLSCDPGGIATAMDARLPDPSLAASALYVAGLVALVRGRVAARYLAAAGALLLVMGRTPAADGRLHLVAVDVGQGEALVLRSPRGRALLVDAGPGGQGFGAGEQIVAPYLWHLGVRRLDAFVLSHAHPDHAGGAPGLLAAIPPREVWEGLRAVNDRSWDAWSEAAAASSSARLTVLAGHTRDWDGVSLRVLAPSPARRAPWTVRNDDSVALLVRYGSIEMLLTGDLEGPGESRLAAGPVSVLKVAHHGSRTSTSPAFVAATRPRIAIVSAGYRSRFGHPHDEVVERLVRAGTRVFRTDRDGTIDVATDGTRVEVCTIRGACGPVEIHRGEYDRTHGLSRP